MVAQTSHSSYKPLELPSSGLLHHHIPKLWVEHSLGWMWQWNLPVGTWWHPSYYTPHFQACSSRMVSQKSKWALHECRLPAPPYMPQHPGVSKILQHYKQNDDQCHEHAETQSMATTTWDKDAIPCVWPDQPQATNFSTQIWPNCPETPPLSMETPSHLRHLSPQTKYPRKSSHKHTIQHCRITPQFPLKIPEKCIDQQQNRK